MPSETLKVKYVLSPNSLSKMHLALPVLAVTSKDFLEKTDVNLVRYSGIGGDRTWELALKASARHWEMVEDAAIVTDGNASKGNVDQLSIFLSPDFAFFLKVNNNSMTSEALSQLWKITTSFAYIPTSLVHFLCSVIPFCFPIFHHSKMTKILSATPLQSPGTLEMPNTKTDTSLANGIGVQEYSQCFKVVCSC